MIDIILYAPAGKATIVAFARNHPPANPIVTTDSEGRNFVRFGVAFCWWGDDGQFMTDPGVKDPETGAYTTPPSYAPGAVAMLRVSPAFFSDRLTPDPDDPDAAEQWARSQVANYIKTNGTPGTMAGGIPYFELDGVRLLRPADVEAFLAANNCTRHMWLGGNSY